MTKTFVIITVEQRVGELNSLLASIRTRRKFDDYDINILYQGDPKAAQNISKVYKNLFIYKNRLGCHTARVLLLQKIKYDVYVNMDDDMLVTDYTDYTKAIAKACEKSTGFVLTNWARTEKMMLAKVPKMADKFVKQVMVYQGGGMVYTEKIAAIMRKLPLEKAVFDNAWPLTAYINGYTNYRYLGSLAIHAVCGRGGMAEFMEQPDTKLSMTDLIDFKMVKNPKGNGRDWKIPLDADLKPLAHYLHKQYKK